MKSNLSLRLQKFIADCGVTSRRKAEGLITEGRVKVNGKVTMVLGTKVTPSIDCVEVDGKSVDLGTVEKVYVVMNKPRGFISSVSDPEGRPTVLDLCKEVSERIYPVGRLDYLSEGLLLLTNDGEFSNKVIHPSSEVEKIYEVKIFGVLPPKALKALQGEHIIDGQKVKPSNVRILKYLHNKTWIEMTLNEGKNREIRKICEACGLTVDKLKRIAIGGLPVEGIAPGRYVFTTRKKLENLIFMRNYQSMKRTKKPLADSKLSKMKENRKLATDEGLQRYRKDSYYETLKLQKEQLEEREKAKKKPSQLS